MESAKIFAVKVAPGVEPILGSSFGGFSAAGYPGGSAGHMVYLAGGINPALEAAFVGPIEQIDFFKVQEKAFIEAVQLVERFGFGHE